MKVIIASFFLVFCYNALSQTDIACVQIPKNISINQEENWSKIFNSNCILKRDFLFTIYNRWGNKLQEIKSLDVIKQFSIFKSDNKGQRLMPAGTYYWTIEYSLEGENQPRKSNGFLNILD
ncbi:MAG: hypothetical protein FGM14_10260 [Flavobacteriales bacterium]|nr:hypothetical protein [Flavobacteriales bacterium]